MILTEIRKRIEKNDALKDQADLDIDKAFEKFDDTKARKFGIEYMKAFMEKYIDPIIVKKSKQAYK